jgi:ABC-2 type transport system ATP-binding protein
MDEAEYLTASHSSTGRSRLPWTPDELKATAARKAGLKDPTLEDAFIALIEASDRQRQAA